MITKAELVAMDERFINILAGERSSWTLWKHSHYITTARSDDSKIEVIGHEDLTEVKDFITSLVDQQSNMCVNEIWDLKKKVGIPFKVNVVVTVDK